MASRVGPVACLLLIFGGSVAAQDGGLELLHRMQDALGGAAKISAIRDYEELVVAETFSATGEIRGNTQKRVRWIAPSYLRIDQVGPGSTYVLFFDGAEGWEILPDRASADRTKGGPITLAGSELEFAKGYASGMMFKSWLADRMPRYAISSPRRNVVRVINELGKGVDITPRTWLPLKESVVPAQPDRPAPQEMHYEEWSKTNGLVLPAIRSNFHDGARLAVLKTEHVKVDSGQSLDSLKARPPDSQPDLRK